MYSKATAITSTFSGCARTYTFLHFCVAVAVGDHR